MVMDGFLGTGGDESLAYEWGTLFASPWDDIVRAMGDRAADGGLSQQVRGRSLDWLSENETAVRFIFVDDPSDFSAIRQIYDDESNSLVPACFVIVRQPDETDTRGDVIFDIFRLSPKSYLWHFHRVYTPPART